MSMGDTDWRPSDRRITESNHTSIAQVAKSALQMNYHDFKVLCEVVGADPDKAWTGLQELLR